MTPLLAQEQELPEKRADRFSFLLNKYRCPSLVERSAAVPFSNTPDNADFANVEEWNAVSYLMPVRFQYWGERQKGKVLASNFRVATLPVQAQSAPANYAEVKNNDYVSRLGQVGPPARKVFAADGTRYLDGEQRLDHDIAPFPNHFGAFTSSGAWWRGDTAYGVNKTSPRWGASQGNNNVGSPSDGMNLPISYRHSNFHEARGVAKKNRGMLNLLFFDNHVELRNDENSRRIDLWYPTGSVVVDPSVGMTDVPTGFVIP